MTTFTCNNCAVPYRKGKFRHQGVEMDAMVCPKCKHTIFTEDQATLALRQLEAQRLKKEYSKKPIKIGNSLGFTIPKDIVDVLHINLDTPLRVHTDLKNKQINIQVG